MASLVIRNLDDDLKHRLKLRAALHNTSMEEEVRSILRAVLALDEGGNQAEGLGTSIWRRFQRLGGVELKIPPRGPDRAPPDFSE